MEPAIERLQRERDLLATASALFNEPLNLMDALQRVVMATSEALQSLVCVYLSDVEAGWFKPVAMHHRDPRALETLLRLHHEHPLTLQGRTLTSEAFAAERDVLIPSIFERRVVNPRYVLELGICSFLTAKIHSHGQMLGMFSVASLDPDHRFDEQDLSLVRAIANQAANMLSSARFIEHEVRLRQRAETMLKVAKAMRSELDLPALLQDAVDVTWQFLQPDFAGVFMLDESHHFTLAASTELSATVAEARWPAVASDSFLERTLRARIPVYLPQFEQEAMTPPEATFFKSHTPTSCAAIPMLHQGTPNGIFVLLWRHTRPHDDEDLALLTGIAELAALAIENHRLIQQTAATQSAKVLAEGIAKEREALIRQIVHDLRNSTQAISLINEEIEFLAGNNSKIQFGISAIDRQINFISHFLKEKLAWIKQANGEPIPSATRVLPLLMHLAESYRPHFEAREQRFEALEVPAEIELPIAEPDLELMIATMLDNAHKYAPDRAQIKLWCAMSDGWATLYVSDSGPGIPIDQQALIGEAGFRGRPEIEGEGRGLSNVKRLVNANGGLFGFTSRPDAGTTFYVTLPTTRWGMA